MKQHTTNYTDTFIEVAEDCPVSIAEIPKPRGDQKTVAELQYEMIVKNPYKYTSDDVLFYVYAERNDLTKAEQKNAREIFFLKDKLVSEPLLLPSGMALAYMQTAKEKLLCMQPNQKVTRSF